VLQHELTARLVRLRAVPVFRTMTPSDLARVAESMTTRSFEKGEVMLREDEPPRSMFMIELGTVTLRRKGRQIGVVRAPGGVGFLSLIARNAGGTEAIAESYVESFELSVDVLDDVFEDHFQVLLGMIRWVSERFLSETRDRPAPTLTLPEFPFEHLVSDRDLGIVERIFLLRSAVVFKGANVNSVARLARAMKELRIPDAQVLWEQGDVATGPYFIVKGRGRLVWNEGKSVQEVGTGYVVGGAESIVGVPRWNRFEMDGPGVLLQGSREALIDLFEDDHGVALHFLSTVASALMMAWDRNAEAGVLSVGSEETERVEESDDEDDEEASQS
jgi:CRP-like cAMP-binding protein